MINDYRNFIHYVYLHVCPMSDDVFYVGHGSKGRAWRCDSYGDVPKYGHRSKDHSDYLDTLMMEGYCPADWVVIHAQGLSKKEAAEKEQFLIRELEPAFNKPLGRKLLKLTKQDIADGHSMREEGHSYKYIAEKLNVSTMCAHRALTGGNVNEPAE